MLSETVLTKILKYKFSKTLLFDKFGEVDPPSPEAGVNYLLYVHIPFCEELCPYCSFNRYPFEKELAQNYFRALKREVRMYSDQGFDFGSVYIGGGTPTVLPNELTDLISELKTVFSVKEISLETNPNHLISEIMTAVRDAGVNRLSVGVQSFDDGLLKRMERFHKYGSGTEIKERLLQYMNFFDTLNVDMIFNFPTQTLAMLDLDLKIIQAIKADQVTFYPLMVSDITKKDLAKRFGPISYRQEKMFYNKIANELEAEYSHGTAWCFSRKKSMIDEYIVDYDEYIGAGSGSFGYANGAVFANTFSVPDYIGLIDQGKFPVFARKDFSLQDKVGYDFMMKLFGTSLNISEIEAKYNGLFRKKLWKELPIFYLSGAIQNTNGSIKLTRKGRYFWVIMMREFFTGVNNFRDLCRKQI